MPTAKKQTNRPIVKQSPRQDEPESKETDAMVITNVPAEDENKQENEMRLKQNKNNNNNAHLNPLVRFVVEHPAISVIIFSLVLTIIILAIVLPLVLVKKPNVIFLSAKCPDSKIHPRIDCLPDRTELMESGANLESTCRKRDCCWTGSSDGGPSCVFPYNYGFKNFKTKENSMVSKWFELSRVSQVPSFAKSDIANLEVKIEMHTDQRLRVKIFPRRNFKNKLQRWEIPNGIHGENVYKPDYRVEINHSPFSFQVIRNSTNQVIFDTSQTSLVFSDQFIQITTALSSPYVYGIGEHSKETFKHDMNYKSWPLFASNNHPSTAKEKPNLYSQFPMYMNIEPDGNAHLVVFYNSNPSEFYLTPFPSLTYRTIGGILDMYIFTGPTPIKAVEQFQKTFGLPKLPPLWSLGLQIGAKKYGNILNLRNFIKNFKDSKMPFDSVLIGYEHMKNATMFTLSGDFFDLNSIVDSLRSESRAAILQLLPAVGNNTQNYPFSEGVSREKYWILENFFSTGVVGNLLGRNVIYPDFTMEKTREWWKDALQRFVNTDQVIKFDGLLLDYLTPYDDNVNKTCPNNKWNNPQYVPDMVRRPIYNGTICMDSRHSISKHYNIHSLNGHYMIEATAKALDVLIHNRTMLMTRHAFLGTGQYATKWLGEFESQWDDLRRSIVATVEMNMFGFSMAGSDMCGYSGNVDNELCENWIKASAMSPMTKLIFDSGDDDDDEKYKLIVKNGLSEVLNSSMCLRHSLMPFLYTQFFRAAKHGTMAVRPLAFEFSNDTRALDINNQWLWGESLMVTIPTSPGSGNTYLPRGDWYDYYRGFPKQSSGEYVNVQTRRNETNLFVRGGSVIAKDDCLTTVTKSMETYIDLIIALDQSTNFTASGELYLDDPTKKNAEKKDNYHRLINFTVYRNESDGIIEVKRISGRYLTKLSYRDLYIYGLKSKPSRITVNENSQPVDGYKCLWDEVNMVYHVNLQTEVKRKYLLDNEYLSFRWTGGFDYRKVENQNNNINNNNNNNNNNFNFNFNNNNNIPNNNNFGNIVF